MSRVELRAYALPVAELRRTRGAEGVARERLEGLVRAALEPAVPSTRDRLGPIYTRVPGARVIGPDDPTPADLETFLDGRPVGRDRAAATWRLVEVLASGLARTSTGAKVDHAPDGLLAPLGLALPPVPGLVAGWCSADAAATLADLAAWCSALPPELDVVVLGRDTA